MRFVAVTVFPQGYKVGDIEGKLVEVLAQDDPMCREG